MPFVHVKNKDGTLLCILSIRPCVELGWSYAVEVKVFTCMPDVGIDVETHACMPNEVENAKVKIIRLEEELSQKLGGKGVW